MTYKICYWDSPSNTQKERDATLEETAEIDSRKVVDPVKVQKQASDAIQALLDTTAQSHGYDNIISLCSYANSTNLTWQKEGQYGCNFRDACWSKAEQIQTAVQAGTRPLPTVVEVLAEMPSVVWPV